MGKLVILIVLIVVAAWLVRRALARMNTPANKGSAEASKAAADELVRCVHCGLLLPRAEARQSAGAIYCSEEHARLGPTRGRR